MTDIRPFLLGTLSIAFFLVLAFGMYGYFRFDEQYTSLTKAHAEATTYIDVLEQRLADAEAAQVRLTDALTAERAKTGLFERQIREITGTVGTLEKLATTDPELLAKYSKVYFLNENYFPSDLALIDKSHLSDSSRPLEIHARVKEHLEELIDDAKDDDIELRIASAYRSFGVQAALKNGYVVLYGVGANRFSADQGYSEHQLGTTVDFTTKELGSAFTSFGTTDAYEWLLEHAHQYGFILSYPKENTHYVYEPWHWRYVGRTLATNLHEEKRSFYDLDQREIDTYLVSIFD